MKIQAEKWHAFGNDFILVDHQLIDRQLDDKAGLSRLAQALCNRHEGVGADGLICFDGVENETRCRIFNTDGSEAEISGNGVRCLAGFLKRELPREQTFRIHSLAGLKVLTFLHEDPPLLWFRADMGKPDFRPAALPARIDGESALAYPIIVDSCKLEINLVSLGNPHCVLFVSKFESQDWMRLGQQLESHSLFPHRTNVEFVRLIDLHNIEIRIWERGVGKTFSSGTCSCASAAVSIQKGQAKAPVQVHNEKGVLTVDWRPDENIFVEGPAAPVWKGEFLWNAE